MIPFLIAFPSAFLNKNARRTYPKFLCTSRKGVFYSIANPYLHFSHNYVTVYISIPKQPNIALKLQFQSKFDPFQKYCFKLSRNFRSFYAIHCPPIQSFIIGYFHVVWFHLQFCSNFMKIICFFKHFFTEFCIRLPCMFNLSKNTFVHCKLK